VLMALCNNRNDGLWASPDVFNHEHRATQLWTNQYAPDLLYTQIQNSLN
jgi:hypothetical protein